MFWNLFRFIVDIFIKIISYVTGMIFYVFLEKITNLGQVLHEYYFVVDDFFNDIFFPGIKFSRDTLIYITGLPVGVFKFVTFFGMLCFGLFVVSLVIRFVLNGYSLFRTGSSAYSTIDHVASSTSRKGK